MMRRCKVTGNPCGTDTWMVGCPCECAECQVYLLEKVSREAFTGARQVPRIQIGGPQIPGILVK